VQVNVADDDTGVASRQTTLTVTNATGAVCALGQIQGNIDGQAFNGACAMFAKDNWVAAVVKLEQAVGTIEAMVAGGGLSPTQLAALRQWKPT
jgi:hypothetical protein